MKIFPALLCLSVMLTWSSCEKDRSHRINITTEKTTPRQGARKQYLQADDIILTKELSYDLYTLEDTYPYRDTSRVFQWEQIKEQLAYIENFQHRKHRWGILVNRGNKNGQAPEVSNGTVNDYNGISDAYGVARYQSVPVYDLADLQTPVRYGRDGSLVRIVADTSTTHTVIENVNFEGRWCVPNNYLEPMDNRVFNKVVVVDRTNQNISAYEKSGGLWLIRSMNPATTGLHAPPYQHETPLGIFVVQEKKQKMYYTHDGSPDIAGYAPYASRFCNGAYIHGVPTNHPEAPMLEFSRTLGTTPRSHMCVRTATSHAQFIFDWAPVHEALVVVID